jgi:hypothetical protein
MFTATLLVAQVFLIAPSRPPLSPAEAVAVLRSSRSDRNVTDVLLNAAQEAPRAFVVWAPRRALQPMLLRAYRPTPPWVHVAQAPYGATSRTLRIVDVRSRDINVRAKR